MFKRIFQNHEGRIMEFSGVNFSTVKGLVNSADNSVIVLWLHDQKKDLWYRLFIDGIYCGVDEYSTDQSGRDLDDGIDLVDYSDWFNRKTLLSATVFSDASDGGDLQVLFNFGLSECRLVYIGATGICSLHCTDDSDRSAEGCHSIR